MFKRNLSLSVLLVLLVFTLLFASCSNFSNPEMSEDQTDISDIFSKDDTSANTSHFSENIELIVPEYLELPNIGDTYQLEPESTGIKNPTYSYKSGAPTIVSVDENGLITVHSGAIVKIYVTVTDSETGSSLTKEITVIAGDIKVPASSASL